MVGITASWRANSAGARLWGNVDLIRLHQRFQFLAEPVLLIGEIASTSGLLKISKRQVGSQSSFLSFNGEPLRNSDIPRLSRQSETERVHASSQRIASSEIGKS